MDVIQLPISSQKKKTVNCSMQSGQSPPQRVVKRIRAYGNALYKCHTITITINTVVIRKTVRRIEFNYFYLFNTSTWIARKDLHRYAALRLTTYKMPNI